MKFNDFLTHFHGVKAVKENEYMALCPAHDDHNPSLSIGLSLDRERILLHCHAGCEANDILNSVGLTVKNLYVNEKGNNIMKKTTYTYYNSNGTIAYTKTRTDYEDGTKKFYFEQPNGTKGIKGIQHQLYNLPAVLSATKVYFVEGEKCADAVIKQGFVATTLDTGAKSSWYAHYTEYLKGKEVIVIPDNDNAGMNYAKKILQNVHTMAEVDELPTFEITEIVAITSHSDSGNTGDFKNETQAETIIRLVEEKDTILFHDMAEYYSVELSQKVTRGMKTNAEKCLSNGGTTPLGYKIVDHRYVLDEEKAPIVREIYTKYANGWSIKEICDSLNERHIKTAQGAEFNKSSLHTMLKNRKYLGIYIYKNVEVEGGMPRIIDDDLFKKVQDKMTVNKKAPARARAKAEYLLTTKLFCGYCKSMLVGHSSNQISTKGIIYNYYKCKNSGGSKPCKKKMVMKDYIEDIVVNECRALLTPKNIRRIAKEVVKISASMDDSSELKRLENLLKTAHEEKNNQMASIRKCTNDVVREMIIEDLSKIAADIKELERQITIEKSRHYIMTEEQIIERLAKLATGDINNPVYRKTLIKLFVNKIFLYDDKFTITFNTGDEEVTITDILLDKMENASKSKGAKSLCLSNAVAHHYKNRLNLKGFRRFLF